MAARKSYASDRRQSGGYSSARSKAGQTYVWQYSCKTGI